MLNPAIDFSKEKKASQNARSLHRVVTITT